MGRRLSVYEKNQLRRYGLSEAALLAAGTMPVEYLTGRVEFAGWEFVVNKQVLIPRVETEELLDLLLRSSQLALPRLNYLEVGVGSGAISLALLLKMRQQGLLRPSQHFYLTDASAGALLVAKSNSRRLLPEKLQQQIHWQESDLLTKIPQQKFNLVVANLPYIPSKQLAQLPASVKNHEPLLALHGGSDGFVLINRLLSALQRKNYLHNNAQIFLEVEQSHDLTFIRRHYPQLFGYYQIKAHPDQFQRQRFLQLTPVNVVRE